MLTFVPADLYISKESDLDDLPEQPQDQVRFPRHHVVGVHAHHRAPDRRGRIQSQDQILLPYKHSIAELFIYMQINAAALKWENVTPVTRRSIWAVYHKQHKAE